MRYKLIYFWRGERLVHSRQLNTESEANELTALLNKEGVSAYVQKVLDN